MSFYGSKRDLADRMFAQYGRPMILRRVTEGAFDPGTETAAPETSTDYTQDGLSLNYDRRLVDGVQILESDRRVLLSAKGLAVIPDPTTDKLVIGGDPHEIVVSTPLSPGDTVVYFEIQARGA